MAASHPDLRCINDFSPPPPPVEIIKSPLPAQVPRFVEAKPCMRTPICGVLRALQHRARGQCNLFKVWAISGSGEERGWPAVPIAYPVVRGLMAAARGWGLKKRWDRRRQCAKYTPPSAGTLGAGSACIFLLHTVEPRIQILQVAVTAQKEGCLA